MALTRAQRRRQIEVDQIAMAIGVDHWNIEDLEDEARIPVLEVMKNQLIRGEIVMQYTLIDEHLTIAICDYFFRRRNPKRTYRQLWRTKRFRIFNHHIMDETNLLPKMRIVHEIAPIPGHITERIRRIDVLRNEVAHSFFPENRKAHMPKKARLYRGSDIFTKEGVDKFIEDCSAVSGYLIHRLYGIEPEQTEA